MIDSSTAFAAILVTGIITYLTRFGGIWAMQYIPLTKRMERGLEAMVGSVFVAFLVPKLYEADISLFSACAAAFATYMGTRKILLAMIAGVLAAIIVRQYF